tara:strand:+ start:430 stop:573 length:144 start_codon:yes stop_codon:yes gene_type:complete
MAKKVIGVGTIRSPYFKHRTSIGSSPFTKPKNKYKRVSFKKYRGQGR